MSSAAATATMYVKIPVSAKEAGVAVDPTSGTVSVLFAALNGEAPAADDADWLTADWETDTTRDLYYARCLVGPDDGETTLTAGTYQPWVKITGIAPETVIIRATGTHTAT